jgi:hypothetical protein
MNCAVNPTATKQCRIGSVDNGRNILSGDITDEHYNASI